MLEQDLAGAGFTIPQIYYLEFLLNLKLKITVMRVTKDSFTHIVEMLPRGREMFNYVCGNLTTVRAWN